MMTDFTTEQQYQGLLPCSYLRLSADVNMMSTVLHTGLDNWLTKESVLERTKTESLLMFGSDFPSVG